MELKGEKSMIKDIKIIKSMYMNLNCNITTYKTSLYVKNREMIDLSLITSKTRGSNGI